WRSVRYYQEGLGCVVDAEEKYGYVDLNGNVVIPCQFVYGGWFSEGLAAVAISADYSIKYGFIDKTGKIVIPCQWENAYSFEKGVAKVQVKLDDGTRVWKKIDKTGKYVE
ncbi:MAG: WG repeat-containing protein, partial [Paludibacteraceae bacterium]|nr:WG repeat-containing protein [Paludibacteraceae bacterium]